MQASEILPQARSHYLAFVLDARSRAELLNRFAPQYARVIAHHVTLKFALSDEDVKQFHEGKFDELGEVTVLGHAAANGAQCVSVAVDGESARPDGSFYHVTISVEPPVKPAASNHLRALLKPATEFTLSGSVELVRK